MISDSEIIGHKFNKLTPIKRVEDQVSKSTGQHHPMYECICDCGAYKIVRGSNLIYGAVKSCGCIRKESYKAVGKKKAEKLIGKRFGRLEVLEWLGADKNKQSRYRCRCDCGNETNVYRSSLMDGETKSCGCYSKEKASETATKNGHNNAANLIGHKTGRLTVIERLYSKNNSVIWRVCCDCGSEIELSSARLLSGGVQSCGCMISKGEEKIAKYLTDHQVEFEKQKHSMIVEISDASHSIFGSAQKIQQLNLMENNIIKIMLFSIIHLIMCRLMTKLKIIIAKQIISI